MNDPKVFVNFRNDDGQQAAAHLYAALVTRFEASQIFRSSESIKPGEDYIARLRAAARECEVLLALIGTRWLTILGDGGRPRLFDGDDWVRSEIAASFDAGKTVVPVLLDRATMPQASQLPADIAGLANCQYRYLNSRDTKSGIDKIATDLETMVPGLRRTTDPGAPGQHINAESSIVNAPQYGNVDIGHQSFNPPPRREGGRT